MRIKLGGVGNKVVYYQIAGSQSTDLGLMKDLDPQGRFQVKNQKEREVLYLKRMIP